MVSDERLLMLPTLAVYFDSPITALKANCVLKSGKSYEKLVAVSLPSRLFRQEMRSRSTIMVIGHPTV